MSRFHDEFFRQGSPAHDALMIKCLSKKGIEKICNQINVLAAWEESVRRTPISIVVCDIGNDHRKCVRIDALDQLVHGMGNAERPRCEAAKWDYDGGMCRHSNECWFIHNKSKIPIEKEIIPTAAIETKIEKETEVIMKNGTFIVGYADAILDVKSKAILSLQIADGWTWADAANREKHVKILIEAKPELTSIGDTIRQLKTYKDCMTLRGREDWEIRMVITTYSKLDEDSLEYLANEGISVVVFEESK